MVLDLGVKSALSRILGGAIEEQIRGIPQPETFTPQPQQMPAPEQPPIEEMPQYEPPPEAPPPPPPPSMYKTGVKPPQVPTPQEQLKEMGKVPGSLMKIGESYGNLIFGESFNSLEPWQQGLVQLVTEVPLYAVIPGAGQMRGALAVKMAAESQPVIKALEIAVSKGLMPIEFAENLISKAVGYPFKMAIKGVKAVAKVAPELVTEEAGFAKFAKEIPFIEPSKKPLATVEAMWQAGRKPKQVSERALKLQEQMNDIYYGLRRMQARVTKKATIMPGAEDDLVTLLTRAPGVANAGATRYALAIDEIKKIAPKVMADDINTILYANHAKEVLVQKGAKRVMAGGFKAPEELDTVLVGLRNKLGTKEFSKANQAAEIVKRIYTEERTRLVQEGILSKELGDLFAQKYPWYNPLHYVEYAEKEVARGKAVKPFTVISSGLRRLSEKGTAKEAVAPLEVLADQLIRNEVRIHKNQVAKAIVTLAKEDMPTQIKKISGIRPVAKIGEKEIPAKTLEDLQNMLKALRKQYDEALGPATEDTARSIKIEEKMESIRKLIRQAKIKGLKATDIVQEARVEPELIFRPTKGEIEGTLSFFENGVRQIYKVPDFIYREANTLSQSVSHPIPSLIGALNGISRAAFTTFSPPFVVSNMLNDMLTAFITRGILPTQTAGRLIASIKGLANDKVIQSFRLAGGYQMRFYGRSAGELAREVGVTGGRAIRTNESFLSKVWQAVPKAGEAGEQSTRMALFKRQLDKTLPGWKKMTSEEIAKTPQARKAAADSVELTINFGRGAYLVKAANPFVIFLNANMEAMKLPFRTLRDNPMARWRLAGVMAGATGLTAYNLSYPEYFDIPDSIRWGSMLVMMPSKEKDEYGNTKPNYALVVPRTREWGMFLGSTTYAMEKLYGDNPTEFGKFAATMAPQLAPIAEVPVPQVIGELLQQQANWDYYWSAPIVPRGMEQLPTEEQVTPWTSRTIETIAKTIGVSPVRAQHFANGIFGGAAQTVTSVTDYIANLISPVETEERIVNLAQQYQGLGTEKERQEFLGKLRSSTQTAMFKYLRQPEKQIPVVSAVGKRIMPERGGQLRRTEFEEMQPYKEVLPKYLEDFLSKEQMKSLDIEALRTMKAADIKLMEDYSIATMAPENIDPKIVAKAREAYRAAHPELDAALNFWGQAETTKSNEAIRILVERAFALGIPPEAIPRFKPKKK